MIGILVEIFHQPVSEAWNTTMMEFTCLLGWKHVDVSGESTRMSPERLVGLEEHLRKMGALDG